MYDALLCEWPIESIGKCLGVFFHPHLHIKSNKSAYIEGICFRMLCEVHIKSNKNAYIAGIGFKMYIELRFPVCNMILS